MLKPAKKQVLTVLLTAATAATLGACSTDYYKDQVPNSKDPAKLAAADAERALSAQVRDTDPEVEFEYDLPSSFGAENDKVPVNFEGLRWMFAYGSPLTIEALSKLRMGQNWQCVEISTERKGRDGGHDTAHFPKGYRFRNFQQTSEGPVISNWGRRMPGRNFMFHGGEFTGEFTIHYSGPEPREVTYLEVVRLTGDEMDDLVIEVVQPKAEAYENEIIASSDFKKSAKSYLYCPKAGLDYMKAHKKRISGNASK